MATPARSAISRVVVSSNPFSMKSARAALRMRASLSRLLRSRRPPFAPGFADFALALAVRDYAAAAVRRNSKTERGQFPISRR
jgi:hypothetical protein